ncbi:EthD family reductase [[Erwinia] mediterraneensis]|uniref:EthD family reductase n=1 Tax=[Erwinia] mediterraneensis TaxID=2161819 RepID=UPI00103167F6|nr:EthD family reductase [[Erwinia] mediterraneensis]
MKANNSQVTVFVYYQGTAETRFDRDFFVTRHLPLCMESWQQYGLLSVTAFFPALQQEGTIAICECVFRDEAAVEASFNSPEVPKVMADVPLYTDATPQRVRAVAL